MVAAKEKSLRVFDGTVVKFTPITPASSCSHCGASGFSRVLDNDDKAYCMMCGRNW